ncbi:hypothetical protein [Mycobacterium sp.]|uniref:MmyB family transcriptional regulator n=1 Tax=Mycobacterium sp. TaxID=1785 RepID=UPI003C77089B
MAGRARRRNDADKRELVENLLEHSPEFAELWARHEVAARRMQPPRTVSSWWFSPRPLGPRRWRISVCSQSWGTRRWAGSRPPAR